MKQSIALFVLIFLSACMGEGSLSDSISPPAEKIQDVEKDKEKDEEKDPDEDPDPELCDGSLTTPEIPLRRLTRSEFTATMKALTASQFPTISPFLSLFPQDSIRSSIKTDFNPNTSDDHARVILQIATGLASDFMKNEETRSALVSCDLNDTNCERSFVTDFGKTAFRRPLLTSEIDEILEAGTSEDDPVNRFALYILTILQSPELVFVFESEGTLQDGAVRLTPYEVATRLSFQLIGAPADDILLSAAANGELENVDQARVQVERLMQSDAFKARLQEMWRYYVGRIAEPTISQNADYLNGINRENLFEDMEEELNWFFDFLFWDDQQISEWFTNTTVYPKSDALAEIYGTPSQMQTSLASRPGFLTRPGFLAQNFEKSSPILRGTEVIRRVLCEDIHVPDPDLIDAALANIETDPSYHSTRQMWEVSTSDAFCNSCHANINGYGFLLESFDSIGRIRSDETIYDGEGAIIATYPIDSAASVLIGNDSYSLGSVDELTELLATREETSACLTQRMFEYFQFREIQLDRDGCFLKEAQAISEEESVKESLVHLIANENLFWKMAAGEEQ